MRAINKLIFCKNLLSILYVYFAILFSHALPAHAVGGGVLDIGRNFQSAVRFSGIECSAVKVSQNLYLSAAHCFMKLVPFPQTVVRFKEDVSRPSFTLNSSDGKGYVVKLTEILLHPRLDLEASRVAHMNFDQVKTVYEKVGQKFTPWEMIDINEVPDLALVRVSEQTPMPVADILLLRSIIAGLPVKLTGYGPIYSGVKGVLFLSDEKKLLTTLDAVSGSEEDIAESHKFRFIARGGITKKIEGTNKKYGFISVENVTNTLIPGDSGGPAYLELQPGHFVVIGINSGVSSGKTSTEVFSNLTRLSDTETQRWLCSQLSADQIGCH